MNQRKIWRFWSVSGDPCSISRAIFYFSSFSRKWGVITQIFVVFNWKKWNKTKNGIRRTKKQTSQIVPFCSRFRPHRSLFKTARFFADSLWQINYRNSMGFALKKLSWILVSRGQKMISLPQLRYKLFTKEMCWVTLGHPGLRWPRAVAGSCKRCVVCIGGRGTDRSPPLTLVASDWMA